MRIVFQLAVYCALCFCQNAAFTWSSRSRNSGDPNYHRWAALASNGVYWSCNLPLTLFIVRWQHRPLLLLASGLLYTVATTEGSVLMMRFLLKRETGSRRVGAR